MGLAESAHLNGDNENGSREVHVVARVKSKSASKRKSKSGDAVMTRSSSMRPTHSQVWSSVSGMDLLSKFLSPAPVLQDRMRF